MPYFVDEYILVSYHSVVLVAVVVTVVSVLTFLRSILTVKKSVVFYILRYKDVRSMAPIDFDVEITSPTRYIFIIL